jgi:hypothetical protein
MAGQLGADNPALAAVRTDGKIHTGERPQQVLPGVGVTRGIMLPVFGFSKSSRRLEAKEGPGFLQFGPGIGWGHEAVVSDFDKPGWENVPEKPADELRGGDGHQPLVSGAAVVPGPEGDLALGQAHQPMVGDGHPVGVAAEVLIGLGGAAESPLGVDDPLFSSEFPEEALELLRLFQTGHLALQSALETCPG